MARLLDGDPVEGRSIRSDWRIFTQPEPQVWRGPLIQFQFLRQGGSQCIVYATVQRLTSVRPRTRADGQTVQPFSKGSLEDWPII